MSAPAWQWVKGANAIFYTRTTMSRNVVARAEIIATEDGPSHKIKFHITFVGPGGKIECLEGWSRSPTRNGLMAAKARAVAMIKDHTDLIHKRKLDKLQLERLMEKYGDRYHATTGKNGKITVTGPTVKGDK